MACITVLNVVMPILSAGGGEGVQERLFSTAASEALAAMPSGALPSWAGHQQQQQQQRQQPQDQQRQQRPTAQLRLFWGAAQAQGALLPVCRLCSAMTQLLTP